MKNSFGVILIVLSVLIVFFSVSVFAVQVSVNEFQDKTIIQSHAKISNRLSKFVFLLNTVKPIPMQPVRMLAAFSSLIKKETLSKTVTDTVSKTSVTPVTITQSQEKTKTIVPSATVNVVQAVQVPTITNPISEVTPIVSTPVKLTRPSRALPKPVQPVVVADTPASLATPYPVYPQLKYSDLTLEELAFIAQEKCTWIPVMAEEVLQENPIFLLQMTCPFYHKLAYVGQMQGINKPALTASLYSMIYPITEEEMNAFLRDFYQQQFGTPNPTPEQINAGSK